MAQWFVQRDLEVLGPLAPKDLLAMVRMGTVTYETKVRKDDSPWFPAREVGGLFEAAVKPTINYRCPGCGALVKEPPCVCSQCGRELDMAHREVIKHRIASPVDMAKQAGQASSMQSWLSKVKRRS